MSQFTHNIKRGGALSVLMTVLALYTPYAHAAETCVAAPSCSELGYTLSSSKNCLGPALKCPFDKTKYFCTTAPNFGAAKTLALKTDVTITESGWLYAGAASNSDNYKGEAHKASWYINGNNVGTHLGNQDENTGWYPVAKGDVVKHTGVAQFNYFYFYPSRTD